MSTRAIDAVSLSIMWDRLVGITDEIVSALIRSSFSTIVRESGDLSVVVLDAQGNSMAQGSYSVPSFTGTAATTLRHMLAKFRPDSLEPGDVVATNDAWMGTGHLFAINVMRPVFRNGRIAAYTLSITHLPDIGGLGQEIEFRNDTGAPLTAFCVAPRSEFPAQSLFGGGNGSRRTILIDGRAVHPKGAHTVAPGQLFTMRDAGGGAFGEPANRPRAKVLADVGEGLVTPAVAREVYGVEVPSGDRA